MTENLSACQTAMSAVFLASFCEVSEGEVDSSFVEKVYSGFFSPVTASLVKVTLETPDPGTSNMASSSSASCTQANRKEYKHRIELATYIYIYLNGNSTNYYVDTMVTVYMYMKY